MIIRSVEEFEKLPDGMIFSLPDGRRIHKIARSDLHYVFGHEVMVEGTGEIIHISHFFPLEIPHKDPYELLFWKHEGNFLKLMGKVTRESTIPLVSMMQHYKNQFEGFALYSCNGEELIAVDGLCGPYSNCPPFSPR